MEVLMVFLLQSWPFQICWKPTAAFLHIILSAIMIAVKSVKTQISFSKFLERKISFLQNADWYSNSF